VGASDVVPVMVGEEREEPRVLDLIDTLGRELAAAGVRYCHWKSNEAIDRSLRGENDLDLLVAVEDAGRFLEVLHRLGFRMAGTRPDRYVPGILDLFGLDDRTASVVHAQAHFRLVVGDDMTKNVHLPFEGPYLASCSQDGILPLPSPEFEYLVLLLRMGIKHCPAPAQLARQGRLTASEARELAYLEQRIDRAEVERLRARHLPTIDADLLATCRAALDRDAGRAQRAIAGRRVLRALAPYGRRSPVADLGLRLWRRPWRRVQRSLLGTDVRRRPMSGGLIVAVLGGDGSGKSSAVAAIAATLDPVLMTRVGHLGKPPRSLLTRVSRRVIRRVTPTSPGTAYLPWDEGPATFPGYGFVVWHVLNARDRAREYRRLRRAAARGAVVVCDRFPLAGLHFMDGPRTAELPGTDRHRLARWLAGREARYYARLGRPDLTLVLRVPPDVAVARRPEQDARYVWHRAQEVWDLPWSRDEATVVDASQPHEQVLRQVRRAVWEAL
jgi:thymidylate kinase